MNKPAPKIYRTTNWSSYNQALINRGNLSIWFDPHTQWYTESQGKQGRNQTYSDAAIQCHVLKSNDIQISMDGKGRWVDNVMVERLWRSVKYE